MSIALKRVYDKASSADGDRILVDRLWPRGISKHDLKVDRWLKEIAPSDALRQWFHKDPSRWGEFRRHYLAELKIHREALRQLAQRSKDGCITLLFSSSDVRHNNAVVVKQYLKMLGAR